MSGQRARPAVAADHRSAHPNVAGIPWWGAILSAVVASLIGFAFDAGSGGGALTGAFATLYVIGCLIGVLAVQQSALFTAVIQPPLVLFVTVPAAYFLMHSSEIQGVKDILINCGYPLIQRFPLMFFTSAAVLLIGLARWYFAKSHPAGESQPAGVGGVAAKLAGLVGGLRRPGGARADGAETRPRRQADRRRPRDAKPTARRSAHSGAPSTRGAPSRRHSRAPETEIIDPVVDEQPRRRRPRPDGQSPEPRRRPRPSSSREPREPRRSRESREDRESRGAPSREPRERRVRRDRYDPYDRGDTYDRGDAYERPRPQRERPQRPRYDDYEPYGSDGPSSHHPVSRVRYRGEESGERAEYRSRRREPRDADRWEYDI